MPKSNQRKLLFGLLLSLVLSITFLTTAGEETVSGVFTNGENRIDVKLEVADTPEEREDGLMNRSSLEPRSGMIFVYNEEDDRSFWMKNTYIPLDIIFLDSDKRIISVEKAYPQPNTSDEDLRRYRSEEPAQYVVELPQNFSEKYSLGKGDELVLR